MGKQNGSSQQKARFTPINPEQDPEADIVIRLQPGRNTKLIRPNGYAPFVRSSIRIKGFGPVPVDLIDFRQQLRGDAGPTKLGIDTYVVNGWWFQGDYIDEPVEVVSTMNAGSQLIRLIMAHAPGEWATHNVPKSVDGNITFPTITYGTQRQRSLVRRRVKDR